MAKLKLRFTDIDRLASGELMLRDRTEGMTLRDIAAKHGVGYETVKTRIKFVIDKRIAETVDYMRAEELEALWAIVQKQHEQLDKADDLIERGINFGLHKLEIEGLKIRQSALNALVVQHESIRKLCGIDAPVQTTTQISVTAEKQTDELQKMLALNQQRAAQLTTGKIDETSEARDVVEGEVVTDLT